MGARQDACRAAGVDVPARVRLAGRRPSNSRSRDPDVGVHGGDALPDERRCRALWRVRTGAHRAAARSTCSVTVSKRERRRRMMRRRRSLPRRPARFVDDDVLLVGRDAVGEQRTHVDPEAPEQARTRPVERFADLAVRVWPGLQADDAQARFPQEHAGGQPGDTGPDDRDVIVRGEGQIGLIVYRRSE